MMGRNRNAGKPGAKNPGKTFKRIMAEIMGRYKLHCVAVVLCLIVSAVWTAVVAVSRLMMGAHFLTDVTAATAITLGVAVLGVWLFYFNGKFFRAVWALVSENAGNKNSEA